MSEVLAGFIPLRCSPSAVNCEVRQQYQLLLVISLGVRQQYPVVSVENTPDPLFLHLKPTSPVLKIPSHNLALYRPSVKEEVSVIVLTTDSFHEFVHRVVLIGMCNIT